MQIRNDHRIDGRRKNPGNYAMYVRCQTDPVSRFERWFPELFMFEGSRGILFSTDAPIPIEPLAKCIAAALTYHRDKCHRRGSLRR